MTPKFIEEIIRNENLQIDRVVRNGPRYWAALVSCGETHLILKAVLQNDTWVNPRSKRSFCTSDLIQAEITALEGLGKFEDRLAGHIPRLIDHAGGQNAWTLRTQIPGHDMSGTEGAMIFRPDFYDVMKPELLVDYILSYQSLTPELGEKAAATPQTNRSRMIIADVHFPEDHLAPLMDKVNKYLIENAPWHDEQDKVLSHGEVYPPHIFFNDGEVTMIDWENFGLNNRVSDLMQVWVRAFDDPAWQEAFRQHIWSKLPLPREVMIRLWDIEKLYQSARNLTYLYYSQIETPDQKNAAAESFVKNIEEVLERNA